MCCRATLGESRALVARRGDDVHAERLVRNIDECMASKKRNTATNLYCRKLMADNARMQEDRNELLSDNSRIMARHHAGFKALSVAEKEEYRKKAKFETETRTLVNEEKVIELRSRLRVLVARARASADAEQGVANTLSELRPSDDELEALALESFKAEYKGDGFRALLSSLVSPHTAPRPALAVP